MRTFDVVVDQHAQDISTMSPSWRKVMVVCVLDAWSEAEDRRCGPTMWLHDFTYRVTTNQGDNECAA